MTLAPAGASVTMPGMRKSRSHSVTLTVRLNPSVAAALNAAAPWIKDGYTSRNAWIGAMLAHHIDMRTIAKPLRVGRDQMSLTHRQGRIRPAGKILRGAGYIIA